MNKKSSILRSVGIGFAIILVIIVYAYGFTITEVDFAKTREEERITQLTRILRALAHPNLLEYNKEELHVEVPIYLPCPDGGLEEQEIASSEPYVMLTPACGEAREIIQIEGYNFWPNKKGPINFIPPSGALLTIGNFVTDDQGYFITKAELPNRQPLEDAQIVRATARRNVGTPFVSDIAKSTWDKILETVFLALIATTIGIILAIPISFIAARNLMSDVKSPLTSISLSLIGWPIGIVIGSQITQLTTQNKIFVINNLWISAGVVVVAPFLIFLVVKWALPQAEIKRPSSLVKTVRIVALVLTAMIGVFFLFQTGVLAMGVGGYLADRIGFFGNFVSQLGDILQIVIPVLVALISGGIVGSAGSKLGLFITNSLPSVIVKMINIALAGIAGFALLAILGLGVEWIYQLDEPMKTLWIPAYIGALIGVGLAIWAAPKKLLSIGIAFYYVTRTLLNVIRSVEPLIMVIVFVVWVGIGPFAGSLALALHTVAALAKLFSEQVESIMPGPLEAVTATGANRLQTIVYAVVPQIIPPYISFTMYRWDINVRMSTIIGFAGGGGIGFLLQQNIRLLDYRAASVQMLAIAIVVASMDYVSSVVRERYV